MRLYKILIAVLLFIAVERFCHRQTEGFRLSNVQENLPPHPEWEIPSLSSEDTQHIDQLLDQPFFFFDAGFQSYVFISKDRQTILKLFKHHHLRSLPWLTSLPLPERLRNYCSQYADKRYRRFLRTFSSCTTAYTAFKEKTGLLYVHINPTDCWKKKLTILDKIGIAHTLDLDTTQFVLQKKAERVDLQLETLMRCGEDKKAKECLSSIIDLLVEQGRQGLLNTDATIRKNMGFIDQTAIIIDTGALQKHVSMLPDDLIKKQILKSSLPFRKWLKKHHPSLVPHFEKEIENSTQSHPFLEV
ncbi:MAG: hypothetical protein KGZ39_05940 [Simkania sp.]|nr:hypothetical protein [Simkania sp.]